MSTKELVQPSSKLSWWGSFIDFSISSSSTTPPPRRVLFNSLYNKTVLFPAAHAHAVQMIIRPTGVAKVV